MWQATRFQHLRLAFVAFALAAQACGGGESAQQDSAASVQPAGDSPPANALGADRPDPAMARERLLFNANMVTPDAARIVSYTETDVRYEGAGQLRTAIVSYVAELEFTADTYFHEEHKAGDRAQVQGEVEYIDEGNGWSLMAMGIYPR